MFLLQSRVLFAQKSSTSSAEDLYQQKIQEIFRNFEKMRQEQDEDFDHFFDPDKNLDYSDVLKRLQELQKSLPALMEGSQKVPGQAFQFQAQPTYQVSKEEKEDQWIYRITVPDLENKNLKVEVKEGLLRISVGEKRQEGQNYTMIPMPMGIDERSIQYKKEKDQILVIIPKGRPTI
jgi:HSP20 family molecular chaperone IbpA